MKNRAIVGLLLACCAWGAAASAAQVTPGTCDRECLRGIAADERMGIVWLRMAWGVRERGGDQLTVWEMFKVYDGQIHAVEAFMRILPIEKRNGGWE
jgi:hypothetical protein